MLTRQDLLEVCVEPSWTHMQGLNLAVLLFVPWMSQKLFLLCHTKYVSNFYKLSSMHSLLLECVPCFIQSSKYTLGNHSLLYVGFFFIELASSE